MPLDPTSRIDVAHDHFKQGRQAEAEVELRAVLNQTPGDAEARGLLGALLLRQERLDEAEAVLAQLTKERPDEVATLSLMGSLSRAQGDASRAIPFYQRLITLGQETAETYNQLGSCWLQLGEAVPAGNAFKRAVELDRSAAISYYNLGLALKLAGISYETFYTFRRAIELDPGFLDSYLQLWQAMRQLFNWHEGLPIMEAGYRLHPSAVQMKLALASTYGKVGRREEAENLYQSAAAQDPAGGPPYAFWLQEEGRFADSIPVLKGAIAENPVQGQAYYNLAIAKCFEVDGKGFDEVVLPLLENEEIGPEGHMFLNYAMAKFYEQTGDFERAMQQYGLANAHAYRLYNSRYDNDPRAVEEEMATLAQLYSREKIEALRQFGSSSDVPVFVVGMIRTGTTLFDQILSSHRDIKSAGEQPFWQVSTGRVNRRWLESGGTAADVTELEARYLQVLKATAGEAKRVTDKMPTNFMHLGLMSIVFPRAKFIHLRRHPVDTCLSIYTTFLGSGTQFAYNQENIVDYYRAYRRTMDYWRSVLPAGQMIEIDYEALVTDKEKVVRAVLEFCGLDWDESTMSHESNRAQVSTPSLWAARQPVNTGSVERWRRYEPWLGALRGVEDLALPKS